MLSPLQKSLLAFISLYSQISRATTKLGYNNPAQRLASVAHAVTQAFGGTELEDGSRMDVQLLRLHAQCVVCTSPTVMLNPLWGMAWLGGSVGAIILMIDLIPIAAVRASVVFKLQLVWC